jgi:lipoyl(octanoyl) transferase
VSTDLQEIEWRVEPAPILYEEAIAIMEERASAVAAGHARELIWLLEHPPVYTGGTSADPAELIDPRFPVVQTGRGGRYTYHGPGQRIGYLVLDLNKRGRDIRHFVDSLEDWLIVALAQLGIEAFKAPGRTGIWTKAPTSGGSMVEAKIGAIGVRVRRWITLHGFSVNLSPDLANYGGIVPCGLPDYPVTSALALDKQADFATFDRALQDSLPAFFQTLSCLRQNEA